MIYSTPSSCRRPPDEIRPGHFPQSKGHSQALFLWTIGRQFAYNVVSALQGLEQKGKNDGNSGTEKSEQEAEESQASVDSEATYGNNEQLMTALGVANC